MAEPTENAIWDVDLGGPREPCINWGPDPPMQRGNFRGEEAACCEV